MKPEQIKAIARKAAENEFKHIIKELKESARLGCYSSNFTQISDGAIDLLKSTGYKLDPVDGNKWRVSC